MALNQSKLEIPTEFPQNFVRTPREGLTAAQAERLKSEGLSNKSDADNGRSVAGILFKNFFTFFNMLNIALAICLMLVGSYKNMLFMGVVISNTLISTVQEIRARNTIKKLKIASQDNVIAIREGKDTPCRPEELVKGDLVRLSRGSQAPADAIVIEGKAAFNEALITGESVSVPKSENDWVLSGSFVTEGSVICQLERVGDDSYVNRLTKDAKQLKSAKSQLMSDLDRLLHYLTIILVPLGILLFLKEFKLQHLSVDAAVKDGVAAMIGMIPEGLMLLTSVALAVGVVRLGKKGALVQELYGIETLARANVLCLDKTGTLTTGELSLGEIIPLKNDDSYAKTRVARYLGAFVRDDSAAVCAMRQAIQAGTEAPKVVLNFSSERKKSAAGFEDGTVLVLGAPSFVLGEAYGGETRRLCEELASKGKRVMLLCEGVGEIGENGELPQTLEPVCVITLEDTIRESAADSLKWFNEQGVEIKIISGDDPVTVSSIGERLRLTGADKYIDVSLLKTDEEVADAADKYVVFGRVSPERKRVLVQSLKAKGLKVAMTGDGVNDIPALRAADCSICMAGGSEAAKHASQLTLVASDFTALPMIVAEGRRAVNNVTRAASLFLVKTLYSFLLSLTILFMPATYPFEPIQLTLISSFTVGIPSFFLSLEPNSERIRGSFLITIIANAMPSALAVSISALILMLTVKDTALASTLATLSAAITGIITLIRVCRPMNRRRAALIGIMAACITLAISLFPKVFSMVRLTAGDFLLLLGLTVGAVILITLGSVFTKRYQGRKQG